ncbi:MAG TPA: SRPBCC domain-containing protein [Steroidobacteraceae bacterium]|nr:SRPBCC domain-containing protein [Steroidobacteraceae bacterium]
MSHSITLAVDLPAPPAQLYRMYVNPKLHAAITGGPVKIQARAGAHFEAFGGALRGTVLQVIANRLVVQSWRSTHFGKRDVDSTLVLTFLPHRKGGRIMLTHVNVAERDYGGVSDGWAKYYFVPWRAYLESR